MSLETAGFIKDLVSTNPEGTDPKSQGDDHIRMIKAVLKAQFPGLTDGIGVTLTENNLNFLGGIGSDDPVRNLDTIVPYTCFIGCPAATTGTKPPGMVGGEMIINVVYNSGIVFQMAFVSRSVWTRVYSSGAWQAWICLTPLGVQQTWQTVTGSRAFDTLYTNDTGRPIMVSVLVVGVPAAAVSSISLLVSAVSLCQVATSDRTSTGNTWVGIPGTGQIIVPAGATYQVNNNGGNSIVRWAELR